MSANWRHPNYFNLRIWLRDSVGLVYYLFQENQPSVIYQNWSFPNGLSASSERISQGSFFLSFAVYLSIYLFIYLFVYLCIYLFQLHMLQQKNVSLAEKII